MSSPFATPVRRGPGRPRKGPPSATDVFLATNQPAPTVTQEIYQDDQTAAADNPNGPVQVEHTTGGTRRMWRLTAHGSVPVEIATGSLGEGIRNGLSITCHDCGMNDHGPGVNECPGRPGRMYRQCPRPGCGKRMYDPQPTGAAAKPDDIVVIGVDPDGNPIMGRAADDPMAITNDDMGASTPQSRTFELVRRHVAGFHKDELQLYFPGTPRDLLGAETPRAMG